MSVRFAKGEKGPRGPFREIRNCVQRGVCDQSWMKRRTTCV